MHFFDTFKSTTNQSLGIINGHSIFIKREDLLHPIISGNKYRKLNYIFQEVVTQKIPVVITFGGAFSNHLAATALAGKESGIKTIGIVRGEEWQDKMAQSSTLNYCASQEMQLIFVSRSAYKKKETSFEVKQQTEKLTSYRLIPEGGTETLSVKGCSEILTPKDSKFDVICTSVGTGGTLAGLIQSASEKQTVIGFNALKNSSVSKYISSKSKKENWEINSEFTFGGYAKTTSELIKFMNSFYKKYQIPLDPVYTGKLLFAIFELIKTKNWRWGKNILAIHTGGLQGITGINQRLQKMKSPILSYVKYL